MAKKKSNKKRDIKVYLIVIWTLFVMFGVAVFLLFHGVVNGWFGDMPTFEELENPETNLATEIYSADGKLLGTYYIENRSNVSYADISPDLINALIAYIGKKKKRKVPKEEARLVLEIDLKR